MEIGVIKQIIKNYVPRQQMFVAEAQEGERYYRGETDILFQEALDEDNPLRNADNRISTNWHGLLVDQKASYLFTYPPTFETQNDGLNKKIVGLLGDEFPKFCKDICVDASNTGVGWAFVWDDENNQRQYALVKSEQVIPIYSKDLKQRLIAVLRVFSGFDDDGNVFQYFEYWTDTECYAYQIAEGQDYDYLEESNAFINLNIDTGESTESNVLRHDFGEVPFVPFYNNNLKRGDLSKVKKYIDVYDKVFSGFINDLDDIQQVILILTNYDGTDKSEFLRDLKKYKTLNLQNDGEDDKSGLTTLAIEIPIEAREKVLNMSEKQIYKQGQGVDPNPEAFGNSSGVALKYLYSLLELKCGLAETEFRLSFGKLIRLMCEEILPKETAIIQTWTRNAINNDVELAEIAVKSKGVISDKTIIKNHPWVSNPTQEIKDLEKQNAAADDFTDVVPIVKDPAKVEDNAGTTE